jgi:hypothetical protein
MVELVRGVEHGTRAKLSMSVPPSGEGLPTPTSRRGQHEVVIHRTVTENTATNTQFPMLSRTDYQEWTMLMQVNFEVAGWWYIVEPEEGEEIHYRLDRLALATISCSVPDEMLSGLHDRRMSVVLVWEAIKRIRVRV